jgi:hypothetical protein
MSMTVTGNRFFDPMCVHLDPQPFDIFQMSDNLLGAACYCMIRYHKAGCKAIKVGCFRYTWTSSHHWEFRSVVPSNLP